MILKETLEMKNKKFNEYLNENLTKINSIVPKNPSISKNDEWREETFWDEGK